MACSWPALAPSHAHARACCAPPWPSSARCSAQAKACSTPSTHTLVSHLFSLHVGPACQPSFLLQHPVMELCHPWPPVAPRASQGSFSNPDDPAASSHLFPFYRPYSPTKPTAKPCLSCFHSLRSRPCCHNQIRRSKPYSPLQACSGASPGNDTTVGALLSNFHYDLVRILAHQRHFLSPAPMVPSRTPQTLASDPRYTPCCSRAFVFAFRS